MLGITPNATVQGSQNLNVIIVGQNFVDGLGAWLGSHALDISVSGVADTLITGALVPDITTGVYALTVQNPDGQRGILSPAFTIYPPPQPPTPTLSGAISTFGPAASPSEGDNDYVQIIFFETPDTAPDNLYIRIFDADTGGTFDDEIPPFNTVMTYTVRGGVGAYSNLDARRNEPGSAGINSGVMLAQQTIGVDDTLNESWLTLPVTRVQGELIGGRRVFKLVVQGASGDDGNWYHVALSRTPDGNTAVDGARTFAFSWCVMLPNPGDEVAFYPYVPQGADRVVQHNFDFDAPSPGGVITLLTPQRSPLRVSASGNGTSLSDSWFVFDGESAMSWTAHYVAGESPADNTFCLWFFDEDDTSLSIFTIPVPSLPPP